MYRTPTTSEEESHRFYQEEYTQAFVGMPTEGELRRLVASSFQDAPHIAFNAWQYSLALEGLGCARGARMLDFGCSWGYNAWLLAKAGYSVQGFEISRARCGFAREKLGIDAVSERREVRPPFDVFFTANVIEHVPSVAEMIEFAWRMLKPGGLLFCVTCNGSAECRAEDPERWHRWWGHVHPQLLDDVFYEKAFGGKGCLMASSPFEIDEMRGWDGKSVRKLDLRGPDLLVAVRRGDGA